MNYQTQIIFDGYKMMLRYKKRDTLEEKFNYTMHSEYYPPMTLAGSQVKSSIVIPEGTIPTPVIPIDIANKAAASFFMTGMKTERTEDNFIQLFKEFVKPEDRDAILEIKLDKTDVAIIFCKSWEDCNRMVSSYKDSRFYDEVVSFMLFSDNPPAHM